MFDTLVTVLNPYTKVTRDAIWRYVRAGCHSIGGRGEDFHKLLKTCQLYRIRVWCTFHLVGYTLLPYVLPQCVSF